MLRMNHTSTMPVLRLEPNGCGGKSCKYEGRECMRILDTIFGILPFDILMCCQNESQKPLCRSLVSPDTLSALWWSQPALLCQWSAVSPPATGFLSERATAWGGMEQLSGSWNGTTLARFCGRMEPKCDTCLYTVFMVQRKQETCAYTCVYPSFWNGLVGLNPATQETRLL